MAREQTMISIMGETRQFDPPEGLRQQASIKSLKQYKEMYQNSLEDTETFWGTYAQELDWFEKWAKVFEGDFERAQTKWFVGGRLNAAYNCLDRHLSMERGDKVAFLWEGVSGESKTYTYRQLHREVCRFANVLKHLGVKKGDRVALYLPMIPELPIAMLACARIGAIHSVVFGGFSAESLRERILDCGASLLVTANYSLSRGKNFPSKKQADLALQECPQVKRVVVVRRLDQPVEMLEVRDAFWDELMSREDIPSSCPPESMESEDPLFILYTSGSTGKPKGVMHTSAGYLLFTLLTLK